MDGWAWGPAWLMGLFMILIVALVAWLVWSATRGWDRRPPSGGNALDVLDDRYARGEIDRDEYLRRREDIRG
ncbi:MAG: SHOCT domain-containing protein [Actinobacteria bacterium]|nr:SHOCT domain-containing protein [Actinomycetota bacterium]